MLILHGSWLPQQAASSPLFVIWGEEAQFDGTRKPRGRTGGAKGSLDAPYHPFSAPARALREALARFDLNVSAGETLIAVRLPSVGDAPQPSRPFIYESAATGAPTLRPWAVATLALSPNDAYAALAGLPIGDDDTPGVELGDDLRFWAVAARFALELLAGQRFVPTLVKEGDKTLARWRPVIETPDDITRRDRLAGAMPPLCRAHARTLDTPTLGPRTLLNDFLNTIVDTVARYKATWGKQPRTRDPALQSWLRALSGGDPTLKAAPPAFVEQFLAWAHAPEQTGNFRICFRLDPPDEDEGRKPALERSEGTNDERSDGDQGRGTNDERSTKKSPKSKIQSSPLSGAKGPKSAWRLHYLLQANDDPSLLAPAEQVWRARGATLKYLNRAFEQPQERLLAGLGQASRVFPPIEESLRAARPIESALTTEQAYQFLREAALLLQGSGFGVLLPALGKGLNVRAKLTPKTKTKAQKGGVAGLNFDSIIQFDWQLAIGDQSLTPAELAELAALKMPLVQVRGQWVELRPDQIEQALELLKKQAGNGDLSLAEAMRMALAPDSVAGLPVTEVETEGWFGEMLNELSDGKLAPLPPPPGLQATLRHYQQIGFSWLAFLRQYGLGACLADDMGLGKTLQTISLLLQLKETNGQKASIVICPTSVVSNWYREVGRFAPSLRVMVHHGAERKKDDFAEQAAAHDLVISSYALLHRDAEQLGVIDWAAVILDEAQNIKNPDTKQSKAARALRADHRIALTGTPVENRLAELWSIFQFINPGYLGTQSEFQARFARPIERTQDADAAKRLKSLVGPFILRRLKTDPKVISDLPAKNEMKVFCTLTKEQVTLYEAAVVDSLRQIEESEGIQRRGLVLSTLMKLKQICNHPAQFLKDQSEVADRSGKLSRLVEMLEEVRTMKERVLIFTQFSEMGKLMREHLQRTFGDEVLFLYGSTTAKAREQMVRRFQDDPHGPFAFILSIKAGGVGLNLTRANHVFHFDRWWNPAVENQATDRAFRIGQTRNVQVYKYICAGTLEERIDEMIERKQALADRIVGTSEDWITEMSTNQLRDLFVLRKDALA
jgi:SNF2 family DNA or RNA helicase